MKNCITCPVAPSTTLFTGFNCSFCELAELILTLPSQREIVELQFLVALQLLLT